MNIQAELDLDFWNGTSVCRYAVGSGAFAEPGAFASDAIKKAKAAKVVQELQLLGDGTYYRVSVAGSIGQLVNDVAHCAAAESVPTTTPTTTTTATTTELDQCTAFFSSIFTVCVQ